MSDLKKLIIAAGGAHGVYLAAKHDSQLKGKITRTNKGTLRRDGKPIGDEDLASILVYLTGKYGITPSRWELVSGLVAAASKQRMSYTKKPPPPDFVAKVKVWLNNNSPSASNPNITTERIAADVIPDTFSINNRSAEMKVAGALRVLGLRSKRMMIEGVRHYRWFPTERA